MALRVFPKKMFEMNSINRANLYLFGLSIKDTFLLLLFSEPGRMSGELMS